MDIILQKQTHLQNHLDLTHHPYDMINLNKRFSVVRAPCQVAITDNSKWLYSFLSQVISNSGPDTNSYHIICQMFNHIESQSDSMIPNKIADLLKVVIRAINQSVRKENGERRINISEFNQIHKYYHDIGVNLYRVLKLYQKHLTQMLVTSQDNRLTSILNVLEKTLFYEEFMKHAPNSDDIVNIQNNIIHVDLHNIEQLLRYVNTIHTLITSNVGIKLNKSKLSNSIRKVVNTPTIINCLNAHFHRILLKMHDTNSMVNSMGSYVTIDIKTISADLNRQKHNIINLLMRYCDKHTLYLCYSKFLKSRILDLNYKNFQMEISNIKLLANAFGKVNAQTLLDMIGDIMNSRKISEIIHGSIIKTTSTEYANLSVKPSVLNPLILTNSNWKISQSTCLDLNYPPEHQNGAPCCLTPTTRSPDFLAEHRKIGRASC